MPWRMRIVGAALFAALLLVAAVFAVEQVHDAFVTEGRGLDFSPLRHATDSLLRGVSVYSDRRFVYPPSAAVALLPLSAFGYGVTLNVWLVLTVVAVAAAALLALAPWRGGVWPLLAVLAAALLLKSDVLSDSLWLGNVSLFLAPVAVAVLLLYEAGHWRAGSALLVVSLLVKPLLIPLILLPLLQRRWRAAIEPLIAGCVALGATILFVPGGGHFFAVLQFLLGGSSLTGRAAVYNISISGLSERLGLGALGIAARVLVAVIAVGTAVLWARTPARPGTVAATGTLLLLALFLAGTLAEDHYLLVATPCLLAAAVAAGRPAGAAALMPALVLVVLPRRLVGGVAGSPAGLQVRYLLAEVLIAIAAVVIIALPPRRRRFAGAGLARRSPHRGVIWQPSTERSER
jgi:arabinofuranan 3-O-arabinosyltransferase